MGKYSTSTLLLVACFAALSPRQFLINKLFYFMPRVPSSFYKKLPLVDLFRNVAQNYYKVNCVFCIKHGDYVSAVTRVAMENNCVLRQSITSTKSVLMLIV